MYKRQCRTRLDIVGGDGDDGVRVLHFDAFELHILEGRIKMGVHGGNNIDSVLFQFIPDAFLMQGSPGSSSACLLYTSYVDPEARKFCKALGVEGY